MFREDAAIDIDSTSPTHNNLSVVNSLQGQKNPSHDSQRCARFLCSFSTLSFRNCLQIVWDLLYKLHGKNWDNSPLPNLSTSSSPEYAIRKSQNPLQGNAGRFREIHGFLLENIVIQDKGLSREFREIHSGDQGALWDDLPWTCWARRNWDNGKNH